MNIGLFGYGVIGKGAWELVNKLVGYNIYKICCLNPDDDSSVEWLDKPDKILDDDSIDTVVELMGGYHPAYEYVKAAILAGKNVVTANKALICKYYDELVPLAVEKGVKLRFSPAVGGGISWLHELERVKEVQTITEINGIFNGTSNFILDNMTKSGMDYEQALRKAQELGYAEADPSADIDGIDTWNKIVISTNFAFDVLINRDDVPALGIRNITAKDIQNFREHDYTCKLLGCAKQNSDTVAAYVQPCLVESKCLSANVEDNYNLISYVGDVSGLMSFYGQGAGRYPTAGNVVLDLIAINNGKTLVDKLGKKINIDNSNEKYKYYVSSNWDGDISEKWNDASITDFVSVKDMTEWASKNPDVFVAAIKQQ